MMIFCPHCSTEMQQTEKNIFCPNCGILHSKFWIINTAKKLTPPEENEADEFAKDLCKTIEKKFNEHP